MHNIAYILFLSVIVIYIDWEITKKNWGSKFNGIGCIDNVLNGVAKTPMRFRVLVPWICSLVNNNNRMMIYTALRWVSITFALSMAYLYFNNPLGVCLLAMFFVWAALFDYTDVYIEVGLIALVLYLLPTDKGSFAWVMLGVITFLAVLNRESGLIIPVIAFMNGTLVDGVWCTAFGIMAYIIPRAKYNEGERYCSFNLVKENIRRIKLIRKEGIAPLYNLYNHFILLSAFMLIVYFYGFNQGILTSFDYLMMVFYGTMIVPSIWMEIRVFSPMMLSVIPIAVKGLV